MGLFGSISFSKFLVLFLLASVIEPCLSSRDLFSQPQQCIHHHFSALLRLKRGFRFAEYPGYTNLSSWNPDNRDCCTWEGIACDTKTGHVISLVISDPSISGQIDFESLSQLRSLQILDLAYSSFDPSPIPSAIGQLTNLTHLDFFGGNFYGQIPLEMSSLINLVSLNLSYNVALKLEKPSIGALIQNLSSLRELCLDDVEMSSESRDWSQAVSSALPNLRKLSMSSCHLSGPINPSLFQLRFLSQLHLSDNNFSSTDFDFSSKQVDFIGNWSSLESLTELNLRTCSLSGPLPSWIVNFTKLEFLDLSDNYWYGPIPSSNGNGLLKLTDVNLSFNMLNGTIPSSLLSLPSLSSLILDHNQLGGLGEFHNTSPSLLEHIQLNDNNLQGRIPDFLRSEDNLIHLDLSNNRIEGEIPSWIWKVGNGGLLYLNLSHNALHMIEAPIPHPSLTRLRILDLNSNILEGSLPIPSSVLLFYSVSNNSLSGEISMSICNLTYLKILDLSSNKFSGYIPQCLGEISDVLVVLNLRGNAFNGSLLQTFKQNCFLQILDLSENKLQGQLPISLANCKGLVILNLKNNQIHDIFPPWVQDWANLGLANLRILMLRSNNFYGPIELLPTRPNFSLELQIVDLSFNNFNGSLPSAMFLGWKVMTGEDDSEPEYIKTFNLPIFGSYLTPYYEEVMISSKRLEMDLKKIPSAFTAIDLSNNHFQGQIPKSIGILKSLRVLNMSHNGFTGPIPKSLENLTLLESLDLSENRISGHIPQELLKLTFLEVLNLSKNQLTGSIPQAKQFLTFSNDSFQENLGLCGPPLSRACEDSNGAPSSTFKDPELLSEESEYEWKMIAIGFGIGYGVGIGAFCWALVLWAKGRRAYNKFVYKMLLLICPFAV